MYEVKINSYDLYCLIAKNGFATYEDLYYLGFNDKKIDTLIKSKTITQKGNKYYIGNLNELNYNIDIAMNKKEYDKAMLLHKKCSEMDPNFRVNIFEMFSIAVRAKDYEFAIKYFQELRKTKNTSYDVDNNVILFLLSNITELPKELQEQVKSLEYYDLMYDKDNNVENSYDINKYNIAIYNHDFLHAVSLINDLCNKTQHYTKKSILLKYLCIDANENKKIVENKMNEYLTKNNITGANRYMNSIENNRSLSKSENVNSLILQKYSSIKSGKNLKQTKLEELSLEEAIKTNNFDIAMKLSNSKKSKGSVDKITYILLNKVNNILLNNEKYLNNCEVSYDGALETVMPYIDYTRNTGNMSILKVEDNIKRINIYDILSNQLDLNFRVFGKNETVYFVIENRDLIKEDAEVFDKYESIIETHENKAENYYRLALIKLVMGKKRESFKYLLLGKYSWSSEYSTKGHIEKLLNRLENIDNILDLDYDETLEENKPKIIM